MVVIRLSRRGAKKFPFYDVVVADQRHKRDGRFTEKLGYFNPVARGEDKRLILDMARIDHWMKQGAKPSDRVLKLIKDFKKSA